MSCNPSIIIICLIQNNKFETLLKFDNKKDLLSLGTDTISRNSLQKINKFGC